MRRALLLAGVALALAGCQIGPSPAEIEAAAILTSRAHSHPAPIAAPVVSAGAGDFYGSRNIPQQAAPPSGVIEVALYRTPGAFYVNASINGSPPIKFQLDTGASTVAMPLSMAMRLTNDGYLSRTEFRGMGSAQIANGSSMRTARFMLSSMTLGGVTVHDVPCMVGPEGTSFLLGLGVLNKFPRWSIDNRRAVLIVGG